MLLEVGAHEGPRMYAKAIEALRSIQALDLGGHIRRLARSVSKLAVVVSFKVNIAKRNRTITMGRRGNTNDAGMEGRRGTCGF